MMSTLLLLFIFTSAVHLSASQDIPVPDCSSAASVVNYNTTSKPLNEILKTSTQSVCLNISSGHFTLEREPTTYGGLNLVYSQVIITGQGNNATIVTCQKEAGLGITGYNVTIRNITFTGCATLHNSTSHVEEITHNATFKFWSALYFEKIENLYLLNVMMNDNRAVGVTMYNVNGSHVLVQDCTFSYNYLNPDSRNDHPGGGGLYIEFTYCEDIESTSKNCTAPVNSFTNYFIRHSHFKNNIAVMVNQSKTTFIVPHQVDHVAFSRGGGLSIFFKRNANNINIFIENCTFYDNSAQWGGGVFVEFHDDTHNNSVYLSYSWFYLNFCFYQETGHENSGLAGGGARLGFVIIGENSIQNNLIEVISCNFTNNICMNGGGASFYTTKEISSVSTNKMIFRNCMWEKNYGMFGFAINLHLWQGSDIGVLSTVEFENGTFQKNLMGLVGTFSNQQGFGALYVDHIPVSFTGSSQFLHNNRSALVAIASSITVNRNATVTFMENEADFGGAILLSGYAYLKMLEGACVHFENNTAKIRGGAIYAEYIGKAFAVYYASCFIRPENYYTNPRDWGFRVSFVNNRAKHYGNDIYSTSLLPCIYPYVNVGQILNVSDAVHQVFSNWSHVFSFSSKNNSIATDGIIYTNYNDSTPFAFPGKTIEVPVTSRDELGHQSDVALVAQIQDSVDPDISLAEWITHTDGTIQIKSNSTTTSTKELHISFSTMYSTFKKSDIRYEVLTCPDGYVPRDSSCVCGDVPDTRGSDPPLTGLESCSDSALTVDAYYWAGHRIEMTGNKSTKYFAIGSCPDGYCNTTMTYLPLLEGSVTTNCVPGRRGLLCGQCEEGYMPQLVSMGQVECTRCTISNNETQNIAGGVMYFVLENGVLLLFCSLILFLGLSITQGGMHSLVFYSSILPTILMYETDYKVLKYPPLGTIYDVWHFKFFAVIKTYVCMLWYTTPLTTVLLEGNKILVVIVLMLMAKGAVVQSEFPRCCSVLNNIWAQCRNKVRNLSRKYASNGRLADGFATLVILSYAKITEVSFKLLSKGSIQVSNGSSITSLTISGIDGNMYVASGQGNVSWNSYDVYFIVALLLIVVSGMLPLFLLYHSLLPMGAKKFPMVGKCYIGCQRRPLLDSLYKGYKDNRYFFSAFYLLYRTIAWAIFALFPSIQRMAFLQFFLSIILGLHCMVHPFEEPRHNQIETLNLLLLVLINALKGILIFSKLQFIASVHTDNVFLYFYIALILLPAFILICYVSYNYIVKKIYIRMKACIGSYEELHVQPFEQPAQFEREEINRE